MTTQDTVPRVLANRILHLAQVAPDREVCGLVSARDGKPFTVWVIDNVATDPRRCFWLDEAQLVDALRTMRELGETLFALFHSHPDAPASPSATDLSCSAYPDALYLIVSLGTCGVLEMNGFRLVENGSRFLSVDLRLADE